MPRKKALNSGKEKLEAFKHEVAREIGVPLKKYNGDLTAKQCGAVGGEMVKRMVQEYEKSLDKEKK